MMLPTTKGRGQNPINNFQYDPFPLPAVRTLSNLKSMALEFDGGEPTNSILTLLRETASLPSIRMLGIGSFTFQSVDDLVDILVAGPHLTGVHVSACLFNNEFRTDDGRPDFALDYCRELRTVVFTENKQMDLLLRALPSASNITGLTLGPHTVPEIDPDFPELDDDETLDDFHDLVNFVNLENLILLVVDTGAWIADALAMVRSPALHTLSLFCWCENLDSSWESVLQDLDLPLRRVDTMLSETPFRDLQRICVTIFCREREPPSQQRNSSTSEVEPSESSTPEDLEQATSSNTVNHNSATPSGDTTDEPEPDGLWVEQQVREFMTSCHERKILEVQAKIGEWVPAPYWVDARPSQYSPEILQASHLGPIV
ncbi:hypothetical protein VTO73DRAFT_15199 [Trametes versicolor]